MEDEKGLLAPLLAVAAALLVAACSKVALLGRPTESNSVNLLGVSGTASRWKGRDAVIAVRFVNGKVAFKSFDKPGAEGK